MNKNIKEAMYMGELKIGDSVIPCAVLEDGTRVLSRIGFIRAIGRKGKAKGGRKYDNEFKTPVFLTANTLKPFVGKELTENSKPIPFALPTGGDAIGYRAELLPQVCNVFLEAADAGVLTKSQEHIATQCRILIRGFAVVGISALVDEATGYQDIRARDALHKILEQYIAKELMKWTKTFPDEFYRQLFRLRKWRYSYTSIKRPAVVGRLTNDLVYDRLAPGVLDELKERNPKTAKGTRKHRHHQWLTRDVGHPRLREHLASVIALMTAAAKWEDFKRMINRALPRWGNLPLFDAADRQAQEKQKS
jgi:hypothetical protein